MRNWTVFSISFLCGLNIYLTIPSVIQIGAIFEGRSEYEEKAMEVAIDMVNNKKHPGLYSSGDILKHLSLHLEPDDVISPKRAIIINKTWDKPFDVLESSCFMLKQGVVGIFNLLSAENSDALQSVCDAKDIPVVRIKLDTIKDRECCSVNLFPHAPVLAQAFSDLIIEWKWTSFTIVYETQQSLIVIAEMLKKIMDKNVVVRKLYFNKKGDYMDALKDIRKSGQTNFVLDSTIQNLNVILKQFLQVGLMTKDYNYVILNLDLHTLDLTPYQHSQTNITGFRLIDPLNSAVIELAEALQNKGIKFGNRLDLAPRKLPTSVVLLLDAIKLFDGVWETNGVFKPKPLFCNSSDNWGHGSTIFNYMKTKTFHGLSGKVTFDQLGFRTDFSLDVIELNENGLIKIGTWGSTEGLEIKRTYPLSEKFEHEETLTNMSFNVIVAVNHPYTMLKSTSTRLVGNDQYEGFAVDLIKEISIMEQFNYTLLRNEDDINGIYNATSKTWNGMVWDVLSKKADLAIGDITINRERQTFLDFTSPFMSLGVQILYHKPRKSSPNFFAFAMPFTPALWMFIGVTFIGMLLMFYITARICPAEWYNPYPCLDKPQFLINQYNISNCMWLIIANSMQEGADIAPRGVSTRALASIWSFFIIIMVSTYTANMAAFLTTEKEEWPFTDVKELVRRADKLGIRYGAVSNGATHKLFQDSHDPLFKKVNEYMNRHPENMVGYYDLGVEKAENENYAFFMESTSINYAIKQSCVLTSVGSTLDEKFYGIAMRKNSTYRNILSAAVLKLVENGRIDELERKWWKRERRLPDCEDSLFVSAPPLNFKHISGIIWITFIGIGLACVSVLIELAFNVFKKYKKVRRRIDALKAELVFYLKFNENTKPVSEETK